MKNVLGWRPTKFVYSKGKLRGSRNPADVAISSRLTVDRVAVQFEIYLNKYAKGRLVDLGCGKVPLYSVYRDYCSEVICVDWNASDPGSHLDFEADLNTPLNIASEEFDTIVLSDVLEHIAEPGQLWNEMTRILRPGGKLIISVPFLYQLHEVPYDYFRYTEYALRHFAMNCRLNIILLHPYGGAPEVITDLIAKNVLRLPVVGRPLCIFFQGACSWLLRTGAGRKLSEKTAVKFPLGYFMIVEKPGH